MLGESSTGVTLVTDAGYKGHNAPKHQRFKVYVAGQKQGLTAAKRAFRRRSAVEPTIGHFKKGASVGRKAAHLWRCANVMNYRSAGTEAGRPSERVVT